jgi:hypothetical protein
MFDASYKCVATRGINGSRLRVALLATTALAAVSTPAAAQNATWLANPGSGDFYDANNWSPNSVPTGTATFGTSATTTLTLGTAGSIGGLGLEWRGRNFTLFSTAEYLALSDNSNVVSGRAGLRVAF